MAQIRKVGGACVDIEWTVLGPIRNNVYAISDGSGLLVVDPSCKVDEILQMVDGRAVDAIVLTHRHYDHVGAAKALRDRTGARVVASTVDGPWVAEGRSGFGEGTYAACPVDELVADGDTLRVGGMSWRVIVTPGHTRGSMCLYLDPRFGSKPDGAPVLVSGDTLFCASIGRTDFDGGSVADMRRSLRRLAELPDETIVLTGHESLTRIGAERDRVFARFA